MDRELAIEILRSVPAIGLVVLVGFLVVRFAGPVREMLPRLRSVEVFGVKVDVRADDVQKAVERRVGHDVAEDAGTAVLARAQRAAPMLATTRVLWIDDAPLENAEERLLMHRLGIFVETARSTAEALFALARPAPDFHVVISDIRREAEGPKAGLEMLSKLRHAGHRQPVIFYVLDLKPDAACPTGAFGITNRPDELLHLVMDIVERHPPPEGGATRATSSKT